LSDGFGRFSTIATLAALACSHEGTAPPPAVPEADAAAPTETADDAAAPRDLGADLAPPAPAPDADLADLGAAPDLPAPADGAPGPVAILIYTRADAYVHDTRGTAAMAIKKALAPLGVTATISEDPTLIAAEKLAPLAGIVLIDNTGNPFGNPGTAAIEALGAFVRAGHGLIGIHAASSGYDGVPAYIGLIGGHFKDHPGGVRLGHCQPVSMFPSVAKLPATFPLLDEFYIFDQYNEANLVDLRCDALGSPTKLPIAWHRLEGQGRVFYTALGHNAEEWSNSMVLDDHVIPGLLWALNRGP
jgi:type 1 glutamine amidotransferase